MDLLVDIGNTRVKWALAANRIISRVGGFSSDNSIEDEWQQIFAQSPKITRVVAVSVGDPSIVDKLSRLASLKGVPIIMIKSTPVGGGVVNGYYLPEQLGSDRLVALIGARFVTASPVCVVDCGTAVTIDGLSGSGEHIGGQIIPGRGLMTKSIIKGISGIVHSNETGFGGLWGRSTSECIDAGITNSISSAILAAYTALQERFGPKSQLILTGGDSPSIARSLSVPLRLEPNLVFLGLVVLGEQAR